LSGSLWGLRLSNKNRAGKLAMALAPSRKRKRGGSHNSDDVYSSHSVPPSWTPSSGARKLPTRRLRPSRATRRPARYTFDILDEEAQGSERSREQGQPLDTKDESRPSAHEDSQSTNSEAEEDARIERSMGVIRKNAASRGTEGGTKYHCDVCSIDITSTVCPYSLPERCPAQQH
jgi:hypothetical protein